MNVVLKVDARNSKVIYNSTTKISAYVFKMPVILLLRKTSRVIKGVWNNKST